MNHPIPGFGDEATWGAVTSSSDPRWTDNEDISMLADALAEHLFKKPGICADFLNELSAEDWKQIDAMIREEDDAEAGRLMREAVQREIRAHAESKAAQGYDALLRETEAAISIERMEH